MIGHGWLDPARFPLRAVDRAVGWAAPWLSLAVRLSLAQAFLIVWVGGLMLGGALGAPLSGAWWSSAFAQLAASGPGTAVQAACPLLLLAGLLTRPAALAMLVQIVLLPPPGMTEIRFGVWAALLAWLIVQGPGAFSLDRLVGRGMASSAVPGSRAVAVLYAWSRRRLGPVLQLGLRLGVGAALVPLAAGPLHAPAMTAMLPQPGLHAAALALALGLGVRVVALALALIMPFAAGATDERLFWLLLLGALVVQGGGLLSIDAWLRNVLSRGKGLDLATLPHVVVVGGGFGGIAAAKKLASAPCRVTLVDRCNHHVFQPLLYQVATASLSPADIAVPIRSLFRDAANVRVLLGEVIGVDTQARIVQLERAALGYDTLILATGARHAYFGRDEWAGIAPGLKTIEDATAIRGRLLLAFEHAENADDPAERAAWLTFLVVGGGPTGVELAGAICELARHGMEREFRAIDPAQARVLLIQSAPQLLPSFAPALSEAAAASLRLLGVEVLLHRRVEEVYADGAVVSGEVVPARTILWAAGVMASPASAWLGIAADRAGRIPVGPDLSVDGFPDIFALGDTAASNGWRGGAVPGLAPAAKQGGTYVGRVIRARLTGGKAPKPFRYRHLGNLATIGRDAAVAEFGRIRFKGAAAWWIWGAAHILFLAGGRSQTVVILDWIWAYLTFKRSTRLITRAPARDAES